MSNIKALRAKKFGKLNFGFPERRVRAFVERASFIK